MKKLSFLRFALASFIALEAKILERKKCHMASRGRGNPENGVMIYEWPITHNHHHQCQTRYGPCPIFFVLDNCKILTCRVEMSQLSQELKDQCCEKEEKEDAGTESEKEDSRPSYSPSVHPSMHPSPARWPLQL